MIVQYASDLHLEFPENKEFLRSNPLKPKGDILLLAGDIVPFAVMDQHTDFFDYVSENFQTTYWIPGNHEYYYFDAATKCGIINEKIRENVILVNNIIVQRDEIRFIFSTLWSKIHPSHVMEVERGVNDFHLIKYNGNRFSSIQFNHLHDESYSFLIEALHSKFDGKTVVVTHHVPTYMNYPEKYRGDKLNDAFVIELFDLINEVGPDYWIFGHSHINAENFLIGKTQILTNQLGYVKYGEQKLFNIENSFYIW